MDRSGWTTVVGVVAALLCASPAAAEDATAARALFDKGLAEMQSGQFDRGCPLLDDSYQQDPRPGTLFTLAECEAKRGRLATAVARYDEFLTLVDKMPPDLQAKQAERTKIATKQRATISLLVPELTLTLSRDAPTGTVVKRDGLAIEVPALGIRLPMDPGEHVLTTEAPDGPVIRLPFALALGEHKQIDLAAPPAGSNLLTRRALTYVVGGAGIIGLGVGVVAGSLMLEKRGVVNVSCRDGGPGVEVCDPTGVAAGNSAKVLGTAGSIGFTVALLGVGAAVVLFVTEPKPAPDRPQTARRLGVGLLGVGRDGAMLGARGTW